MPNPELKNDYGIELTPAGRTKLNNAGLLVTHGEGRRLRARDHARRGSTGARRTLADDRDADRGSVPLGSGAASRCLRRSITATCSGTGIPAPDTWPGTRACPPIWSR